jgi:hypothetical protein
VEYSIPELTAEVPCTLPNKKVLYKFITLFVEREVIKKSINLQLRKPISQQLLEIDKGKFIFYDNSKKQKSPRILDTDFLKKINWVNFRTQANLELPCSLCGNPKSEMHHIAQVRKTKFTEINPQDSVGRMQFLRNRRQVPLCSSCHDNIHRGNYNGTGLKHLFDNRVVNSEGYIIKGIPYEGAPLEQRLKESGWIEKTTGKLSSFKK